MSAHNHDKSKKKEHKFPKRPCTCCCIADIRCCLICSKFGSFAGILDIFNFLLFFFEKGKCFTIFRGLFVSSVLLSRKFKVGANTTTLTMLTRRKRKMELSALANYSTAVATPKKKKGHNCLDGVMLAAPKSKRARQASKVGTLPATIAKTLGNVEKKAEKAEKVKMAKKSGGKKEKEEEATQLVIKPPDGWRETWDMVLELRRVRDAPVDFFGSAALPQRHLGDKTYRFQVLIALMLSSQTKDQTVAAAMKQLQDYGLTMESIQQTTPAKLDSMIAKVGFHNNKTK